MTLGFGSLMAENKPVRVLVVDDSAFMRFTITKHLNQCPGIQVIGSAHDGLEALELIPKLNPDVVTLDVEMPHMDGLSTLKEIMIHFPRPVVMLSSLTAEGTSETVKALTLGAVDFIAKPVNKSTSLILLWLMLQQRSLNVLVHVFFPFYPPSSPHRYLYSIQSNLPGQLTVWTKLWLLDLQRVDPEH